MSPRWGSCFTMEVSKTKPTFPILEANLVALGLDQRISLAIIRGIHFGIGVLIQILIKRCLILRWLTGLSINYQKNMTVPSGWEWDFTDPTCHSMLLRNGLIFIRWSYLKLPKIIEDDLNDISRYGIDITRVEHVSPPHEWVIENNAWRPMVQSYLACVSFVDEQVGRVIDALNNGRYANNTYVVLFSDHGFHIGEKERHAKRSLWEDGSRVPMIIAGPGIEPGQICNKPAQLLDIYPTLLDLVGLEPDEKHEGRSLASLLRNPETSWPHMARTSFGPGNYAIVSERYRFIQYKDGSEEFYDHRSDPHEWKNVVNDPAYSQIIQNHRNEIPTSEYEILGEGSTGHKSYLASDEHLGLKE